MDISATSFRILKILNKLPANTGFTELQMIPKVGISNRQELIDAIVQLSNLDLIREVDTFLIITDNGNSYLNNLILENETSAHNYAQTDFKFAIVQFLYKNNWGVKSKEFPTILKSNVSSSSSSYSDDYNLELYLHQNQLYFKQKNSEYFLTPEGINYYEIEAKKKDAKENTTKESQQKDGIIKDLTIANLQYQKTIQDLGIRLSESQLAYNNKEINKKPSWKERNWFLIATCTFVLGIAGDVLRDKIIHKKDSQQTEAKSQSLEKSDSAISK